MNFDDQEVEMTDLCVFLEIGFHTKVTLKFTYFH